MGDSFRKIGCAECGAALEPQPAEYNRTNPRRYCERCAEVGRLKDNWKPTFGGSRVQAIYVLDENGRPIKSGGLA